jgi:hypothetical protein
MPGGAYSGIGETMREENLFLVLGKYIQRQNENLLTQSLAVLFNRCPVFRDDLLALFRRRSEDKRSGTTGVSCAVTQKSQVLRNRRILVDMEIRCGDDPSPQYVVEAKLTAPLSPKQARKYSEFLKRQRGRSRLVLITMAGVDSELKKLLPKNSLWLTWTEIAELAVCPAHRSITERSLCEQFHEMLNERGIPMVPSVTFGEYRKLALLNRFVESKRTEGLHKNSIDVTNNVMARMQIFTDANWSSLTDYGYKPFARLYAYRPSQNNGVKSPYAEITVGFYYWKKRKHVHERYIYLALDCKHMKLHVWGGWGVGRSHPEHGADGGRYLKEWRKPESRLLFKKPLPDAQREIQTQLEKCLRQFKKSRYYKA